jgi:bifunctional non-homologous end joining protein LigD
MGLGEYKRKRRFNETPEPAGKVKKTQGNSFVVQKHRATRLHYDFRLEMEGVLRSWAIPKGPSFNPSDKRLAVETEDHPIDYGGFEGVIPTGNYGAGKVIIWDQGTYDMVDPETPVKGWKKGKLHFTLHGKKLKGEWVLVRGQREPKQWIFFKVRDPYASGQGDVTQDHPESVISGKRVEEIGEASGKKSTRHWVTPIERELEKFGMKQPGRAPIPKNVQPMLATLVKKPFDRDAWLFELKLDGIRAIALKNGSKIDMWTRNHKSMTKRFPTLAAAFMDLPADSVILDGEIVALDGHGQSHFQMIQPRIHLSRSQDIAAADENIPVYFYAFDLLYLNGFSLMNFPLVERKAVLRKLIPDNDGWIRYTDHVEKRGVDFFNAVSARGLEGIVAKLASSTYQQSRSKHWLKIKSQNADNFVVCGFTAPEGSRKYFGALLLGLYNKDGQLIFVGRSGGGFDDRALAETYKSLQRLVTGKSALQSVPAEIRRATWVHPQLVCEVRFTEWTVDRRLRAPVFVSFRDDIDPKQCRLEDAIPERLGPVAAVSSNSETPAGILPSRVELTNLDKVFWPEDGYTKGDLIRYYDKIAPVLVPHLQDRPLVFKRYPDGIHGQYFYQKDAPDFTPDWVRTQKIWSPDVDRYIRYFIGADREQLVYIANTGAITQNPWMSRVQEMDHPDYVIFDLDPVESPFSTAQKVALELKNVFDELGLRTYPKTSGASGIHIHLPILEGTYTYEEVRIFAQMVAAIVVQRMPQYATIERVVRKRKPEMVYIDFLQNVRGKTVASVYSPRAKAGAPVSTPLKWEELRKPIDPGKFTIRTILKRIDQYGDLFENALADRQSISGFLEALKSHSFQNKKSMIQSVPNQNR